MCIGNGQRDRERETALRRRRRRRRSVVVLFVVFVVVVVVLARLERLSQCARSKNSSPTRRQVALFTWFYSRNIHLAAKFETTSGRSSFAQAHTLFVPVNSRPPALCMCVSHSLRVCVCVYALEVCMSRIVCVCVCEC